MVPRPGATPDDGPLVDRAREGDRAALEALLRRYHDRVHLICLRLCRDRDDADDAAQDALVAIVRGLPRFDGRSAFGTWVYRVATNTCLDELRRRRRRPVPVAEDARPDPEAADDPAGDAVRADVRARIRRGLDELPDEFRAPLVLRDVLDLDYATIAEVLELPAGTVRSRISRGRARLADLLAPDGDGVTPAGAGNPGGAGDVEPPGGTTTSVAAPTDGPNRP